MVPVISAVLYLGILEGRVRSLETTDSITKAKDTAIDAIKKTAREVNPDYASRITEIEEIVTRERGDYSQKRQVVEVHGGINWGDWEGETFCPSNHYVCGIQQNVEPPQGGGVKEDDTAMNDIRIMCCQF